jgi:hypothetical protein
MDALLRPVLPPPIIPTLVLLGILLCVGVEVTLMGNVFLDERAGFLARLRELLALLAFLYAVLIVVKSIRAHAFIPADIEFVYPLTFVLLQWVFTATVHLHLRDREFLLSSLTDKEYETLLHALRDSSLQASASQRSLHAVRILVSFFQATAFVFLAVDLLRGASPGAWGVVLCGVHAVFGFFVFALMKTYGGNQLLLGEGLVVPGRLETIRLAAALTVMGAGLPIILLISRNAAPLPLSILAALLDKLAHLLPPGLSPDLARRAQELYDMQQRYSREMLTAAQYAYPINPLIFILIEVFRRFIVTVSVTALYFFLVSPLLSQDFLESVGKRSLAAFLRRKLRAFLAFCLRAAYRFIDWLRSPERAKGPRGGDRREERSLAGRWPRPAKISLRKQLQVGRILKAFLLLVRWGESRGVRYRAYETPREYSERLLLVLPDGKPRLSMIVEILEEAIFSLHLVDRRRTAGYFSAIREIRKTA